jgi:tryptophanyl-tRNA synthetase
LELQNRYTKGGEGYGHFKKYLSEKIYEYFASFREKRLYYESRIDEVKDILNDGAKKAEKRASSKMNVIREKLGLKY